jgi:hypothetical protein
VITATRIKELQSTDERPFDSGYFVILNWQDEIPFGSLNLNAWMGR